MDPRQKTKGANPEDLRYAAGIRYSIIMQEHYVYILASKRNGTLYVGMAKELGKRVVRHNKGRGSKFVQEYNVHKLVYFEKVRDYKEACKREQELKHYNRSWKIRMIEKFNPTWKDLSDKLINSNPGSSAEDQRS
jgi:putative endonuclease